MNSHLPRKITDIKGKVALAELQRTHYIVVVLALALAAVLSLITFQLEVVNMALGIASIVLLIVLALISLLTAVGLSKFLRK